MAPRRCIIKPTSWLRHCATSWKIAGSIPDGVTGIFHWHNSSGRTAALGLTQPLAEISTRNISWGVKWPVLRTDNLTMFMCRLSWNMGTSIYWNPQGLSRPVMGLLYLRKQINPNEDFQMPYDYVSSVQSYVLVTWYVASDCVWQQVFYVLYRNIPTTLIFFS